MTVILVSLMASALIVAWVSFIKSLAPGQSKGFNITFATLLAVVTVLAAYSVYMGVGVYGI
jgi:aryl carrier-like protein